MGKIKLQRSGKKKASQKPKAVTPSVEELRKTLGFPDGTEFLGYAVYRDESDEFLAEFDALHKGDIVRIVWARTPQLAICYDTLAKAANVAKECNRCSVLGLFDTGNQIATVTMSVNR